LIALVSIGLPSLRDIIREEGRRKGGRKKRDMDSGVKLAPLLGLSPSLLIGRSVDIFQVRFAY